MLRSCRFARFCDHGVTRRTGAIGASVSGIVASVPPCKALLLAYTADARDDVLLVVSVIAVALLVLSSTVVIARASYASTQYPHSCSTS